MEVRIGGAVCDADCLLHLGGYLFVLIVWIFFWCWLLRWWGRTITRR